MNQVECMISYNPLTDNPYIKEKLQELEQSQKKTSPPSQFTKSSGNPTTPSAIISSPMTTTMPPLNASPFATSALSLHLSSIYPQDRNRHQENNSFRESESSMRLAHSVAAQVENSLIEDPLLLKQIETIRNRVMDQLSTFHPPESQI